MPYHTISSSTAGGLQLQENNRKTRKKKKNQIIVVNSDDITRYYNYAKTIKVSLFSLPLPLPLFLLLGKAKEWNQYVYLGRESGMNMEEENPIIQDLPRYGSYFTLKFAFRDVSILSGFEEL